MATKSYKSSNRGITLGKKGVGMELLTFLAIFISVCVQIHVFDFKKINRWTDLGGVATTFFFSTDNLKEVQLSP